MCCRVTLSISFSWLVSFSTSCKQALQCQNKIQIHFSDQPISSWFFYCYYLLFYRVPGAYTDNTIHWQSCGHKVWLLNCSAEYGGWKWPRLCGLHHQAKIYHHLKDCREIILNCGHEYIRCRPIITFFYLHQLSSFCFSFLRIFCRSTPVH